jgi:NADP-dependent aldehyde dehydrogenase
MEHAWKAFQQYKKSSRKARAAFMHAIADELENSGDGLLKLAMQETHLPEARLRGERARTVFQLRSYADACVQGDWLEARIDTANPDKVPPKPDIRKMLVPLGPVVVFGASNFPFAYSTAGGDTAMALAAGCPVVVKAHPAHAHTSEAVAKLIDKAALKTNMPAHVFSHVHGSAFAVGETLVMHPYTKAVGFTGSYAGGKALFDMANKRQVPIPVFAEMGSVNPVFLLPEKLAADAENIAIQYAGSITLGVGQFCTNPGLIFGIRGDALDQFIHHLQSKMAQVPGATTLHMGIAKAYAEKSAAALSQKGVSLLTTGAGVAGSGEAMPILATTTGTNFLDNTMLHQEVFGPYSLLVQCKDAEELLQITQGLEGQLTATLMATAQDLQQHSALVDAVTEICGRCILNGVPTGVEVCLSMHHGGPFPATTDSRFSSVGADGIRRFARPISYQNWPDHMLPAELQNANPHGINRTVNNALSRDAVQ